MSDSSEDLLVEQWRLKKAIKNLETARGAGTSVISLIIPPKTQISQVSKMLIDEQGTASNIKSRVNRQSVLSAITSAQQRLKLYTKIPDNGLALYCGEVLSSDGKEKKIVVDLEPYKPINTFLYMCDNKFHTGPLSELLTDDDRYGFIVVDGSGALFGVVTGSQKTVLQKFTVELPKKHGRGGQSAPRFGRIRKEKRHAYMRRVCEVAITCFITNDKCNVSGIVVAGAAEFKKELLAENLMDPRLMAAIIATLDIAYGGEAGFSQAIEQAGEVLTGVKLVRERKLLSSWFEEIEKDTGKYCFGVNDTINALEMGAVDALVVWDTLAYNRVELRNKENGSTLIKYVAQENDNNTNSDSSASSWIPDGYEVTQSEQLLDWLSLNYKSFGTHLHFCSDKTDEGTQFVLGFGGIGGFLRYALDLSTPIDEAGEDSDAYDPDDDGFI